MSDPIEPEILETPDRRGGGGGADREELEERRRAYADYIQRERRLRDLAQGPVKLAWALLAAIVLVFLAIQTSSLVLGDAGLNAPGVSPAQLLTYTGMKVSDHVAAGQWWRLLSSVFLHLGFLHIVFNGYGLYVLGPAIEKFYGARRLMVMFVGTGAIASLASYFFTPAASAGASGAIYGLAGALIAFGYKYREELPERVSHMLTRRMLPWIFLGIAIGFFPDIPFDNAAHIGGLLSGGLLAFLMRSRLDPEGGTARQIALWAAALLAAAALVASLAFWVAEISTCAGSLDAFLQCYPEFRQDL